MKNIKFAIIAALLPLTFTVHADSLDVFKNTFLKTTRIQEGKVALVDGPDSCQQGRVRILQIDEDQTLTLMLGASPLVTGIGSTVVETRERKCIAKETARFSAIEVSGKRTMDCGSKSTDFEIQVVIQDGGFEYTRKVTSNGKPVLTEVCKYIYE